MDHYLIPPIFIGAFDLSFTGLKDDKAVESEVKKILARKVGAKSLSTIESSCQEGTFSKFRLLRP